MIPFFWAIYRMSVSLFLFPNKTFGISFALKSFVMLKVEKMRLVHKFPFFSFIQLTETSRNELCHTFSSFSTLHVFRLSKILLRAIISFINQFYSYMNLWINDDRKAEFRMKCDWLINKHPVFGDICHNLLTDW